MGCWRAWWCSVKRGICQGRPPPALAGLPLSGSDTFERVGVMVEESGYSAAWARVCHSRRRSSRRSIEKQTNFVVKASNKGILMAEVRINSKGDSYDVGL